MKKSIIAFVIIVAVTMAALVGWYLLSSAPSPTGERMPDDSGDTRETATSERSASEVSLAQDESWANEDVEADAEAEDETEEPQTEEEKREAEEEKQVNAFDDLTDKWQEPAEKGVAMAEVENFACVFRQVPKARQDECLHRALNLIPDENVMLLVGILMDKSMDKEIVETVFNDILNRDEDVKKPILKQIFSDKDHPCWSDVAWILDVTDELPSDKSK